MWTETRGIRKERLCGVVKNDQDADGTRLEERSSWPESYPGQISSWQGSLASAVGMPCEQERATPAGFSSLPAAGRADSTA